MAKNGMNCEIKKNGRIEKDEAIDGMEIETKERNEKWKRKKKRDKMIKSLNEYVLKSSTNAPNDRRKIIII